MNQDIYGRFFLYSLLVHGLLLGLLATNFLPALFFKEKAGLKQVVHVSLQTSLPSQRLPLLKKTKTSVKKKPKPLIKKKPLLSRKKPSQKSLRKNLKPKSPPPPSFQEEQSQAIEKLKALSRIQQIKEELAETPTGSSAGKGLEDFKLLQYMAAIKSHINRYWYLPPELSDKNFRMRLLIMIDSQGQIVKRQIVQPSGNEDFDARVLETIKKALPLPVPEHTEVQKKIAHGIMFNFPE